MPDAHAFQFRFGSIESHHWLFFFTLCVCFNSALVRLRAKTRFERLILSEVSIPLWFDWERYYKQNKAIHLWFQFRFGSIESVTTALKGDVVIGFQFRFGSIERSPQHPASSCFLPFQFRFGSIERNGTAATSHALTKFQFRFGSIERQTPAGNTLYSAWFQFRFGSIERNAVWANGVRS